MSQPAVAVPVEATAEGALTWYVPRNLNYPLFVYDLEQRFTGAPHRYAVIVGFRSNEEQTQRWVRYRKLGGPLAASPGQSPHNAGCAVHVAPMRHDGALIWDIRSPAWKWLADNLPASADARHPLVHGRGSWRWWHIEWRAWRRPQ